MLGCEGLNKYDFKNGTDEKQLKLAVMFMTTQKQN